MDGFVIYDGERAVPVVIDEKYSGGENAERSYTQIVRAAGDLRQDIAMLTGAMDYKAVAGSFIDSDALRDERLSVADKAKTPALKTSGDGIVVGTVENSEIIKSLIKEGKLDEANDIKGKWEAFVIKEVGSSLVIAGSDARGAIYGIYTLSEKIGVSPWYWFSDCAAEVKDKITVDYSSAYVDDGPSVKYRGIFINDEERLIDWAKEKFPTENGTPDVNLYRHVFELLLRLKANTLWPAMHEGTTAFNMAKDADGIPINAKEAAKYGIIMASSHCEMMLRCNVSEWSEFYQNHKNDYNWKDGGSFDYTQNKEAVLGYWRERLETNKDFESILALGIRGVHDGDAECDNLSIYGGSKVNMMADVIAEQRKLICEVYGSETAVPQVFIPYKGMADIYNGGLAEKIPDDVMLMWAEDNYGNLRQTPTKAERNRSGGCGVYYHSSYWSWYNPKSYLWLNSTQIFYMSHQLHRAYDCGAGKYWILNVGDIKPGDIVTELFLKTAWDVEACDYEYIEEYFKDHARRDFHADEDDAEKISRLAAEFYRLCGIKKAEFFGHVNSAGINDPYFSESMIYPFSVKNEGDEGQRLVDWCNRLVEEGKEVCESLDEKDRAAFYQQLYYHIISYRDVAEEYVYLWKNNLAAEEGRYNSARIYRTLSQKARERIVSEQEKYCSLSGGKWSKMVNCDHPAYMFNMNEGVLLVHDEKYKTCEIAQGLGASWDGGGTLRFDFNSDNASYIDVFAKGEEKEKWRITSPEWVKLSRTEGETAAEERVIVTVDWEKLTSSREGVIYVYGGETKAAEISVSAVMNKIGLEKKGYVEANGAVVLEAEHFSESVKGSGGSEWVPVKNAGRSGDCMTAVPFDMDRSDGDDIKKAAKLVYSVYFTSTGSFKGTFYRIPSLNEGKDDCGASRSCRTAIALDDAEPQLLKGASTTGGNWASNVMHMTEPLEFTLEVSSPGWHDVCVYKSDAGIIFDRIVIETESGAVPDSLLGPEESPNNIAPSQSRAVGELPAYVTDFEPLPDISVTAGGN